MQKQKLRIFYIDYDAMKFELRSRDPFKNRPAWFSYDLCLRNMLQSLANSKTNLSIHFTLWYDKKEDERISATKATLELMNRIERDGHIVEILSGDFQSGAKSGLALLTYLCSLSSEYDNDIVYICENDYLHKMNWVAAVEELYQSNLEFDYVSLYDHMDNYHLQIHQDFHSKMLYTDNNIWRTTFSTCTSKIARLHNFKKDFKIISQHDDFLAFAYLKLLNRKLITSIPGLSTHAMLGLESPGVNWAEVARITAE